MKGSQLKFISQIKRDGSGTSSVTSKLIELNQNTLFALTVLSLSKKTYIASEMNSFVVTIK